MTAADTIETTRQHPQCVGPPDGRARRSAEPVGLDARQAAASRGCWRGSPGGATDQRPAQPLNAEVLGWLDKLGHHFTTTEEANERTATTHDGALAGTAAS